jgi:Tol biopolymer transport system component
MAVISPGPSASLQTAQCDGLPIFLVPIDGSHPTVLRGAKAGCGIAWSSRNQIAYDGGGIWVIHPDGGGMRQVSPFGEGPSWSSDGKLLAFNVAIPVGCFLSCRCRYCAFGVVKANGKNFHVATRRAYTEYGEVWSPRGRRILYGRADRGIYVIGSSGQTDRRVTTDSPGQSMAPKLAWSPDGGSIVYAASTGGLYEVGVNGRGKVQLTSPSNTDEDPSWVGGGRGAQEQA